MNTFKPFQQTSRLIFYWAAKEPFPINGSVDAIFIFSHLRLRIESLGMKEHGGNWDPYLRVTLMNGTTFDTLPGYTECEVKEDKVAFFIEEDEDMETKQTWYSISAINTIQLIL